jgi:hypothetical protein
MAPELGVDSSAVGDSGPALGGRASCTPREDDENGGGISAIETGAMVPFEAGAGLKRPTSAAAPTK